jgi:hypothetical protein
MRAAMALLAFKPKGSSFEELLSPSAKTNLDLTRSIPWVQELIKKHVEVVSNIDQNPGVMEHVGRHIPCILASIHLMWGLLQNRPYSGKANVSSDVIFERTLVSNSTCTHKLLATPLLCDATSG